MNPLSILLFLVYQRKVFIMPYVTHRLQVIWLHIHFLEYGVHLCHRSKGYSSGETVGGVSLLVLGFA